MALDALHGRPLELPLALVQPWRTLDERQGQGAVLCTLVARPAGVRRPPATPFKGDTCMPCLDYKQGVCTRPFPKDPVQTGYCTQDGVLLSSLAKNCTAMLFSSELYCTAMLCGTVARKRKPYCIVQTRSSDVPAEWTRPGSGKEPPQRLLPYLPCTPAGPSPARPYPTLRRPLWRSPGVPLVCPGRAASEPYSPCGAHWLCAVHAVVGVVGGDGVGGEREERGQRGGGGHELKDLQRQQEQQCTWGLCLASSLLENFLRLASKSSSF